MKTSKDNILVLSDLHFPAPHPDALEFAIELRKKYRCGRIIGVGDLVDWHAFSTHLKEAESNALEEMEQNRELVKRWSKVFPEVEHIYGNHCRRIFKRLSEVGIPTNVLKSFNDILGAPKGWTWYNKIVINTARGKVLVTHGENAKSAGDGALRTGCSVINGHLHSKAGITYHRNEMHTFWGMQLGCLVDENAYQFRYAKDSLSRNIYSCGVLIDGVPYIEPLL